MPTDVGRDYSRLRAIVGDHHGTGDAELASTLGQVADSACEIVGCSQATVIICNNDGSVIRVGPGGTDESSHALPPCPDHARPDEFPGSDVSPTEDEKRSCREAFDAVVNDGVTLRVPALVLNRRAARDQGEQEPELLGVPIRSGDRITGGLFLSATEDGFVFDKDDEHAARLIATAAGLVVDRSRSMEETERHQRWLTSSTELTRELVAGIHDDPMQVLVDRILDVADADLAAVVLPSADGESLVITSAAGKQAHLLRYEVYPRGGTFTDEVMASSTPVTINSLRATHRRPQLYADLGVDTAVFVPMIGSKSDNAGTLVMFRNSGRAPFSAGEVDMASTFAAQISLALELAEARADRERAALFAERDRIARDLHDHVIQQLFAIGMTLQATMGQVGPSAGERLHSAIDDLDSTILQIRSTIYRLTGPVLASGATLRARAESLVHELEAVARFPVSYEVRGPLDFGVSDAVTDDVLAVLRETLTNVTKHAQASSAAVAIDVAEGQLRVRVSDDGRGIGDSARRSGLDNLRARAAQHGGTMTIDSDDTGTRIAWTVPTGH